MTSLPSLAALIMQQPADPGSGPQVDRLAQPVVAHEHVCMEPPTKTPTCLKGHLLELFPQQTKCKHLLPVVVSVQNVVEGPGGLHARLSLYTVKSTPHPIPMLIDM